MIGIINYGAGNLFSLQCTLQRIGLKYGMINQKLDIDQYDRIIIPGVGHAATAMSKMQDTGLITALKAIKDKPILGICLGMQLMTAYSQEGEVDLLDIFPLQTRHFNNEIDLKIPHMGWNIVQPKNRNTLFRDIEDNPYFYFVHSYFVEYHTEMTSSYTDYGVKFSSSIEKENYFGVQFHPEKSGSNGEQILRNFNRI